MCRFDLPRNLIAIVLRPDSIEPSTLDARAPIERAGAARCAATPRCSASAGSTGSVRVDERLRRRSTGFEAVVRARPRAAAGLAAGLAAGIELRDACDVAEIPCEF